MVGFKSENVEDLCEHCFNSETCILCHGKLPAKMNGKNRSKRRSKNPFDEDVVEQVDLKKATRLAEALNKVLANPEIPIARRHLLPIFTELKKFPVSATMTPDERQEFMDLLENTGLGRRLNKLKCHYDKVVGKTARGLRNKWKSALSAK